MTRTEKILTAHQIMSKHESGVFSSGEALAMMFCLVVERNPTYLRPVDNPKENARCNRNQNRNRRSGNSRNGTKK